MLFPYYFGNDEEYLLKWEKYCVLVKLLFFTIQLCLFCIILVCLLKQNQYLFCLNFAQDIENGKKRRKLTETSIACCYQLNCIKNVNDLHMDFFTCFGACNLCKKDFLQLGMEPLSSTAHIRRKQNADVTMFVFFFSLEVGRSVSNSRFCK